MLVNGATRINVKNGAFIHRMYVFFKIPNEDLILFIILPCFIIFILYTFHYFQIIQFPVRLHGITVSSFRVCK